MPSSIWPLVAVLVGTFALRMAASIVGSTLQLYFGYIDEHFYRVSDTARGIALAVFFIPELIGSPVFGAWSDWRGRRRFMVLGALFGAIGVQITAMTTNLAALGLMRLLGGLSTAAAVPATLSYLSAMTAQSESLRGRVMGLFQIATLAGVIGGIIAGGRLWDAYQQGTFTIDAVLFLISVVLFMGVRELRSDAPQTRNELRRGWLALQGSLSHYRHVFTLPAVVRFAPVFVAVCMILGIWLNHIVGQLVAHNRRFPTQLLYGVLANYRHAGSVISTYGAILLVVFGIGVLVWSLVIGRIRRTTVMVVGTVALFVLCLDVAVLNHTSSPSDPLVPLFGVVALLALLVLSGVMPAALTYLADLTEESTLDRGAIMGLFTVLFGFGGFLGTLIGGPFADWNGIDGILVATAGLGLVAMVLLIRLHGIESSGEHRT